MKNLNYRWEQCYEMHDGVYWAIVDNQSQSEGLVSSHLLVVNHCWADSLGIPFPENEFPKRIIDLLNGEKDKNEEFEKELTRIHQWYSTRWEMLRALIHDKAKHIETEAFNIMANGQRDIHDPPSYSQTLNTMQFEIDRLKAGLSMIAQIIHGNTRTTHLIAEAVLQGADCRKLEDVERIGK